MEIKEIFENFDFEGEFESAKEIGSGNINNTYLITCRNGEAEKRYVLQRINTLVFKKPDELMKNVFAVTEYLREEIKKEGGDSERETLNFIKTIRGKDYYEAPDGSCFRAYVYVKDSVSYDSADTPELFAKSGVAFGKFQRLLGNFPADTLYETIPHFHDTLWRFENEFLPAIFSADEAKLNECNEEIEFVTSRQSDMEILADLSESGALPVRVTHNDTKLNNVMFDKNTGEGICVIDLDTVMPGSALYDFGDSIRFGASTAAEDDPDLTKVSLDIDYFRAYAEGYLSQAGKTLTTTEKNYLAFSVKLMTLELGMRFLTDYLNGSVYFKTSYPKHNLVRAKNQFALVKDIESKLGEMNIVIAML